MRIRFELRPLAECDTRSWWWLTDGWYDLVVGDHPLFDGADYYVARLWEDLVDVAYAALEDVPADLAQRLETGERWDAWVDAAWEDCSGSDTFAIAASWWHERRIDTSHLRAAPRVHLWRTRDDLHVRWSAASSGHAVTSAAAFKDELVRFDRALIEAMRRRIEEVATPSNRSELRREHHTRECSLEEALAIRPLRRWDEVIDAILALEGRIGSVLDESETKLFERSNR